MEKNILIFAPHPDDETIGCGGTMAKRLSEGFNPLIAVLTDGRHLLRDLLKIDKDPTPEEVKEIRRKEVLRATRILGVPANNLMFLDFEDGTLKKYELELEKKVTETLKRYLPSEIYFPIIRDFHPDHVVTNRVVRRCVRKLGLNSLMCQYCTYHKYGHVGPLFERLIGLLKRNIIKVDISGFIELKEKALKEFKSQFSTIFPKQQYPIERDIEKYLKRYEVFYTDK